MSLRPTSVAIFLAALALLALMARRPGATDAASADTKDILAASNAPEAVSTSVLVELFTSEGCSSCPPADALLGRLGRTQPVRGADIIVLEEHVDYWDRLGWKDPFSSEAATARQNEYGEAFGGGQVYTPQMVVDGHSEFVGSSENDALRAIRTSSQTSKPKVQLSWGKEDMLAIHINAQNNAARDKEAEVFLVLSENRLHSDVKRGENAGRALAHDGVTRQFLPLEKIKSADSEFLTTITVHPAREWNRENLRAIVFEQERSSRHILAAASIPFPAT
jgi:hypothetical protein